MKNKFFQKNKIIDSIGWAYDMISIAGGQIRRLLDQGIHLIDLLNLFVGNFIESGREKILSAEDIKRRRIIMTFLILKKLI